MILPPHLFEDIQSKGREICLPIPHKYLKICFSFRDVLNWSSIEAIEEVTEEDILNMAKSKLPIKQLSFRINTMTEQMLKTVERFAPDLEVLEIWSRHGILLTPYLSGPEVYVFSFQWCLIKLLTLLPSVYFYYNNYRVTGQRMITFPRLEKLAIDLRVTPFEFVQRICLKSCSQSLRELTFTTDSDMFQFEEFIDSFKCLTELEILSIFCGSFSKISVIGHLKKLRYKLAIYKFI